MINLVLIMHNNYSMIITMRSYDSLIRGFLLCTQNYTILNNCMASSCQYLATFQRANQQFNTIVVQVARFY